MLKRLSRQPVPRMSGEAQLREQMHRHILREGRFGLDDALEQAIGKVIDSHVIDMRAEILRQQTAEDTELGELEAKLDGLVVKYRTDEQHQTGTVADLHFQRRSAERVVEDPDTPAPAGRDGVEESGYRHGNVGELVGRGVRTRIILWIVLCLAMTADIVAFRQVVERVLNESRFVFPLVVALTATTTYIAHRAGDLFKTAKETNRSIRRAVGGWTLSAVWAAMGIGAFVFRLLAPAPVSADAVTDFVSSGTAAASSADGSQALSAMLLLFLYVLTGAIAVSAGYQRPRVEIEQYRRANRKLRKAEPRLALNRRDIAEADKLRQQLTDLRGDRKKQYAVEVDRCEAAAQRLKAEASMVIRRLLRSGELPWFRRLIGNRAAAADERPDNDIPRPRPASEPCSAGGSCDTAGGSHDAAGDGPSAPAAS